jgi:hypothetical protein
MFAAIRASTEREMPSSGHDDLPTDLSLPT